MVKHYTHFRFILRSWSPFSSVR